MCSYHLRVECSCPITCFHLSVYIPRILSRTGGDIKESFHQRDDRHFMIYESFTFLVSLLFIFSFRMRYVVSSSNILFLRISVGVVLV
jgi:hypothetical protein